jgi:hypothetical protein
MIGGLFVALVVLQVLDWHSTVCAGSLQSESNPLLLSLAAGVPFPAALAVVKTLDIFLAALLIGAWRYTRRRYNTEFLGCLLIVDIVYAVVVFNNFHHR